MFNRLKGFEQTGRIALLLSRIRLALRRDRPKLSVAIMLSGDASASAVHFLATVGSQLRSNCRLVVLFDGDSELDRHLSAAADAIVRLEKKDDPASQIDAFIATYAPSFVLSGEISLVRRLVAFEYQNTPVLLVFADVDLKTPHDFDEINKAIYEISTLIFAKPALFAAVKALYPHIVARSCLILDTSSAKTSGTEVDLRRIESAGEQALRLQKQSQVDHALIANTGAFEPEFYLSLAEPYEADHDVLRDYLFVSKLAYPRERPNVGYLVRKPCPGFHPLVYASENKGYRATPLEDPFAHYLRTGRPKGRWVHPVVLPTEHDTSTAAAAGSVAIHAHFHYPELLPEMLARLSVNQTKADLFVTTTSADRKEKLDEMLRKAGVEPRRLDVVDNRGRDFAPFISLLTEGCLGTYDIVGHFHSKKSPHLTSQDADAWRAFLWEHLLGGRSAMLDCIMQAFAGEPRLGLLFPEDASLYGWGKNEDLARELADRARLSTPLPVHFDFPVGAMFWARPGALQSLLDLRLRPEDFPPEPVPIDGTALHAIERLLPFFVQHAGFYYATSFVRGVRR